MAKIRLVILGYIFFACWANIYPQTNENKYVQDFEYIKSSLTDGYANLHWVKEDNNKIVSLADSIKKQLSETQSEDKAKKLFEKFLDAFKDGHLELQDKETANNNNTEEFKFDRFTSGATVCEYLGNIHVKTDSFSLPFEEFSGFKRISQKTDPFPLAIIQSKNNTPVGIIRIAGFAPEFYRTSCEKTWGEYKKNITGIQTEESLDDFLTFLANDLLKSLTAELAVLNKYKITKLLIDIADNGGGTEWVEAVARTFTSKQIRASKVSLVKEPYSTKIFESGLDEIKTDFGRRDLTKGQISLLNKAKSSLNKLIEETKETCVDSQFWEKTSISNHCDNLTRNVYYASGVFPNLKQNQIKEIKHLASKGTLFSPSKFSYKPTKDNFQLFILVNRNTASAAEYFAALLKDNKCATIAGEKSFGAGSGFINGGVKYVLPNTRFVLKIPNSSRFRKDGTNEFRGIIPDKVIWQKTDNKIERVNKLIDTLLF